MWKTIRNLFITWMQNIKHEPRWSSTTIKVESKAPAQEHFSFCWKNSLNSLISFSTTKTFISGFLLLSYYYVVGLLLLLSTFLLFFLLFFLNPNEQVEGQIVGPSLLAFDLVEVERRIGKGKREVVGGKEPLKNRILICYI